MNSLMFFDVRLFFTVVEAYRAFFRLGMASALHCYDLFVSNNIIVRMRVAS